jgi:hypothetical protein
MRQRRALTSIDILHERDALNLRVLKLEAALARLEEEVEHAREHPRLAS